MIYVIGGAVFAAFTWRTDRSLGVSLLNTVVFSSVAGVFWPIVLLAFVILSWRFRRR